MDALIYNLTDKKTGDLCKSAVICLLVSTVASPFLCIDVVCVCHEHDESHTRI